MVWAGIWWRGKAPLVFVEDTLNAVSDTNMLDTYCQPLVKETYSHGNIFQQDCIPTHTACDTQEYF